MEFILKLVIQGDLVFESQIDLFYCIYRIGLGMMFKNFFIFNYEAFFKIGLYIVIFRN